MLCATQERHWEGHCGTVAVVLLSREDTHTTMHPRTTRTAGILALLTVASCQIVVCAEPVVRTLDNGITLIVDEMHSAPVAAVRFYVRAGSIYEEEFTGAGITHYLEHLIGKGSLSRTAQQIDQLQEEMGNQTNAYTTSDHTCYHMQSAARYVGDMIDLIGDYVFNPLLDQSDIDKQRQIILREMAMGDDDPGRGIYQLLMQTMFRIHPARYRVIGYPDRFRQVTREDLLTYQTRMYTTDNVTVVVVGDFEAASVLGQLEKSLGSLPRRGVDFPPLVHEPTQTSARRVVEVDPSLARAYLAIGYHTIDLFHPDLYALDVLDYILGNGASSRLVDSVRERQGLVDGIGCYSATPSYGAGRFVVTAACDPDKLTQAQGAILAEIARLKNQPVTKSELDKAKKQKEAELVYARGSVESWASTLGGDYLATGDVQFSKHYVQGIRTVTAADIQQVAGRYLNESNMTVAIRRARPDAEQQVVGGGQATRPVTHKKVLPNGITLLVQQEHSAPMVSVQASFAGGLRYETRQTSGMGRVLAAMLKRGTTTRNRMQIATSLENVGAQMSAMSGRNSFNVSGTALAGDLVLLMELMADCIRRPAFDTEELSRVKELSLAAIKAQKDDVDQVATRLMLQELFASHPYGLDPGGTDKSVTAIDVESLRRHHGRICRASQMVLAVYGDVEQQQAEQLVTRLFGDWQSGEPQSVRLDVQPAPQGEQRVQRTRAQQQGIIYFGFPGPTVRSEDRYALDVLDAAFSGVDYPGGRLHRRLRGEGLVYATHMVPVAGLDPGFVMIYAGTEPDKLQRVEEVVKQLVTDVQDKPFSDDEFNRAKKMCISAHEVRMGSVGDRILQETLDELYGLGYEESRRYAQRIESVTVEQVQEAARKYMKLDACVIAVTRPQADPQ